MGTFIFPLVKEFQNQFGSKPFEVSQNERTVSEFSKQGSQLITKYLNQDVWLPIKFVNLDPSVFDKGELLLPFATIRISMKKSFVKTPLTQRKGTVKELYSIDDYDIGVRGFLIDLQGRSFPEKWLLELKNLFEYNVAVAIDNALTNVFLPEDEECFRRVVLESLDIPEVEGGRKHVRPFAMKLESDSIFTLEDE